jgi:hypothetical protein
MMVEPRPNPEAAGERFTRVYVPREGTAARAAIAEQSGVVGGLVDDDRVVLDYEANMHGAVNIQTFADKVHHATERHASSYPTRARTEVGRDTVTEVGVYDGERVVLHPGAQELVAEWLEIEQDALDVECHRSYG